MLLMFPSCKYLKQKFNLGEYSLKHAIEWAKKDSERVADSLKRINEERKIQEMDLPDSVKRVLTEKAAFERTLTDSLMNIESMPSSEEYSGQGFYIISGTFAAHENALLAAGKYSKEGFKTSIITKASPNGSSVEMVSVKIFRDYGEAEEFLKGFKINYDPGAWIFTRN